MYEEVGVTTSLKRRVDELRLWRRMGVLQARVNEALERVLQAEHGMSCTEFIVLQTLTEADQGSVRMSPLANAVGLNQSSVTRLIARLEERGLAERCVCTEDRRGVFGRITDAGRVAVAAAQVPAVAVVTRELDRASFDGETAMVVARLRYPGLTQEYEITA